MSNADKFRFADFTRGNYRRLLRTARERFAFRTYAAAGGDQRFVIWRHDLDMSVHAGLATARIEHDEGVTATYFVLLHSQFYNLLERSVSDRLLEIQALGHDIGLHVDASYHRLADLSELERLVAAERRTLKDLLDIDVSALSFHMPTAVTALATRETYGGLINADAPRFKSEMTYCSDSNGYWRYQSLEDVLSDPGVRALHVLTHPEMWSEDVLSPRERVLRCIEGRAQRTTEWYDTTLAAAGRKNVDRT